MGLTANELSPPKGTGGSNPLASARSIPVGQTTEYAAPVAQRIEHLTTDQKVGGSNPFGRALYQRKRCEHRSRRPVARTLSGLTSTHAHPVSRQSIAVRYRTSYC